MRALTIFWMFLLLVVFTGCAGSSSTQLAQLEGDDESGLGGTGHSDGSGLGGTGNSGSPSGLGGTGIIGEITGFGSIFVNGVEIEIEDGLSLMRNGVASTDYELARGDVVMVLARAHDGKQVAEELQVRNAVVGSVEQVDVAVRRFRVLGQEVQLDRADMRLPQLGQFVEVSGFRDSHARIHATRIALAIPREDVWIYGPAQIVDADTLRIGQQLIDVDLAIMPSADDVLGVRGTVSNGRLRAGHVWQPPVIPFAGRVEELRVQGYLQDATGGKYRINGATVDGSKIENLSVNKDQSVRLVLQRHHAGNWQIMRQLDMRHMPMGRPQMLPQRRPGGMPTPMPIRPMRPMLGHG